MKNKRENILRKAGWILALMMIFTVLAVPAFADDEVPAPAPAAGGSLIITSYTVTDPAGNELQHVKAGEKCRIIVGVIDQRIAAANEDTEEAKAAFLSSLSANIKVTSTDSFATPSLGDISTTTFVPEHLTANGLEYAIILNDITYLGGKNTLSLDISYNNYALELTSISQNISQCHEEAEVTGKPTTLVIPAAGINGNSVVAGSDFTMTVDVLASGGTVGAENVAVSIVLPEAITAASGSTNIFIGSMAPGSTQQVTFQLNASAVANSGSYGITASVHGTSASDNAALGTELTVTVPVSQPERFEISRTDFPEYLMEGEEGYASVSFVNKGKGSIYNVSAEITGEGITTSEGNQYIGNVNPGSESSADFMIQTQQVGDLNALLVVTYEDEKGNVKTLEKEFKMTVEAMQMGDMGDMGGPGMEMPMPPMEESQGGVSVWVWIAIGAAVIAAVVVVIVVVKKKKAKRRAAQLLEDEDEDI